MSKYSHLITLGVRSCQKDTLSLGVLLYSLLICGADKRDMAFFWSDALHFLAAVIEISLVYVTVP